MRFVVLLLLLSGLSAQVAGDLFDPPRQDLTHVAGASGVLRRTLGEAGRAEEAGELGDAVRRYLDLLEGEAASVADPWRTLVQVPADHRRPGSGCFRRPGDVALARLRALPVAGQELYRLRGGARVRLLQGEYRVTGAPELLTRMAWGYPWLPEGRHALLELTDRALEAGAGGRALTFLRHLLTHVSDSELVHQAHLRQALAGALVGDRELARPELLPEGLGALVEAKSQAILTGGVAADLPPAPVPPWLDALLARSRPELALGAPDWRFRLQATVNQRFVVRPTSRSRSAAGFQVLHPLHLALPLPEPVRVGDLLVLTTPERLLVVDLAGQGRVVAIWSPAPGDRPGRPTRGLRDALGDPAQSLLDHYPVPRMGQQWIRLAPVVVHEQGALVAYVVLGEDSVLRGFSLGGIVAKVVLAVGDAPAALQPLSSPRVVWLADLWPWYPSGRPLLRPREHRLAVGAMRDPDREEITHEVAVVDLDADTGEARSLTVVCRPPTNQAWAQDEDVITHVHPVSLAWAEDHLVAVADHRGTVAAVDLHQLGTTDGEPWTLPTASVVWACTYRSLHLEGDATDSGLRGWAASGMAHLADGALVVAPRDLDHLLCIGPDRSSSRDLELPVRRVLRADAQFFLGVHEDQVLWQGPVAGAVDPRSGAGWEGAPREVDGLVLRRGARLEGLVLDPGRRTVRILDAGSGRIRGLLHLGAASGLPGAAREPDLLQDCERMGVSILGDTVIVTTELGVLGWRMTR
jgi:hypothetical protein